MSGTSGDSGGLAAFGAGVPEPVDDAGGEGTDEHEPTDTTEAAAIGDFDDEITDDLTGYERLVREYVRQGHRVDRTAAALDRNPQSVLSDLADHGNVRVERLSGDWLASLFEMCDKDADAVAGAARESRLAVSVYLVKSGVAEPKAIPDDCLRAVYENYHGEYYKLRDELEVPTRDVLWALVDIGLVEPYADFFVARLWPEDFGLSPLNCEDCTEGTAIGSYPCPECGHNPGNGYDDRGEADDE